MRRYLVEAYTPTGTCIPEVEERVRSAAAELSERRPRVRYLQPIFVPEDETCFHLLEATSRSEVAEVVRRAGVSPQRITEAVREDAGREHHDEDVQEAPARRRSAGGRGGARSAGGG